MIKRALIVAVLAAAVYGFFTISPEIPGEEKSFGIDRADVTVEVKRDGSLEITEELLFDFKGSFSGAYRDIPLKGGARITAAGVFEPGTRYEPGGNTALGSYDRPGTFGVTDIPSWELPAGADGGKRIVWHYSAADEDRTFAVRYRVEDAVTAYEDVADVGWFVWGDQWDFWLPELNAEIVVESGGDPVDAWLEPRSYAEEPELGDGRAGARVERVGPGNAVLLRAAIPASAVPGLPRQDGEVLERIRADEQEAADSVSAWSHITNFVAANIVALCAALVALMALVIAALAWRARERPDAVAEHLSEPPEQIPPALAFALATEGDYDRDAVILATLLDLVDRGYYDAATPITEGDPDLMLSIPAERPAADDLTKYEMRAVDFFDKLLGGEPAMLSKLSDKVPEHSASWRKRFDSLAKELDKAEAGEIEWDRDMTPARSVAVLFGAIAFTWLAVAYFARAHQVRETLTAATLGIGLLFVARPQALKRLEGESLERHARWAAFRRWTEDFPRLEDDPPATLKLWRRIMVYAVAFGTAEKVLKSGRIPAPVVDEAEGTSHWLYYPAHSGSWSSNFSGFSSGFAGHVAPESSSGGGGGFSGGGGGFSGGGGGGAW